MLDGRPVCLGLLTLLAFAGCNKPEQGGSEAAGQLAPEQSRILTDVPKPAGFKLDEKKSEDRLGGRRRIYVRHFYRGRGDTYRVRDFYIQHMPQFQWKMAYAGTTKGIHTLIFRKRGESCNITVSRGSWGKVDIEVLIHQDDE